ncbi:MAG: hypothetical protein WCL51_12985 [Bacteroidota bacterium]
MKKNINYFAVAMAVITIISVFLPWAEASSNVSFGGYSGSYHSGGISGFLVGPGIIGLIVAIIGLIMAFNCVKWTFVIGILNFLIGIGYILGWFNAGGSVSYNSNFGSGHASASVNPMFGLFLFVIASVLFGIGSFTYLNNNINVSEINNTGLSENIFCSECGKKYSSSSRGEFCEECGKKL